ncbi:translation initiation factor IF-2-like [Ochotona curzoniae]|uniref:translation initiation factor IF-2-like n=1 Tax=Ochotona curzoniae TaxID=130825 RepID=UPI001B346A39|nr:translation initiation factor IF-2-like [Ochotona curzoniae]
MSGEVRSIVAGPAEAPAPSARPSAHSGAQQRPARPSAAQRGPAGPGTPPPPPPPPATRAPLCLGDPRPAPGAARRGAHKAGRRAPPRPATHSPAIRLGRRRGSRSRRPLLRPTEGKGCRGAASAPEQERDGTSMRPGRDGNGSPECAQAGTALRVRPGRDGTEPPSAPGPGRDGPSECAQAPEPGGTPECAQARTGRTPECARAVTGRAPRVRPGPLGSRGPAAGVLPQCLRPTVRAHALPCDYSSGSGLRSGFPARSSVDPGRERVGPAGPERRGLLTGPPLGPEAPALADRPAAEASLCAAALGCRAEVRPTEAGCLSLHNSFTLNCLPADGTPMVLP